MSGRNSRRRAGTAEMDAHSIQQQGSTHPMGAANPTRAKYAASPGQELLLPRCCGLLLLGPIIAFL